MEIRKKKKNRSHHLTGEHCMVNSSSDKDLKNKAASEPAGICANGKCKLRKEAGGCSGFEGCPGFKARN